tara:strand:- start:2521 stop:3336 length:816 start_codon:yes stop_codon:yes gene_type:complete
MDLEELNKSQIVLLTMLVSFVTSIATGIVTVSLIEEAPSDVTRVVQRVVERTVETVTPETQQATVITREKTIIVKEADLIAAAIADNKSKIVSLVNAATGAFVSLGVFVETNGIFAVDAAQILEGVSYALDLGGEALVPVEMVYEGGARQIALFEAEEGVRAGVESVTPSEVSIQLGQTVVAFIGGGSITQGIVTDLGDGGSIGTSIASDKIAPGAPLINVDGAVVGISTGASRELNSNAFAPIRAAFAQVESIRSPEEETATTTEEIVSE